MESAKELVLGLKGMRKNKKKGDNNLPLLNKPPKKKRRDPMERILRIRRPLAVMVVHGRKIIDIALQFHVTPQTVKKWLNDPEIINTIEEVQEEVLQVHERQYHNLFGQSIKRLQRMMVHAPDEFAIEAIKLIWTAQGRYSPKGDVNIALQQQMNLVQGSGGQVLQRDDAKNALELLRQMRAQNPETPKQIPGAE